MVILAARLYFSHLRRWDIIMNNKAIIAETKSIDGAYLRLMLEKQGWQADVVDNSDEVISRLEATDYQLVLINRNLLGSDGLETTRKIRAWEKRKGKKVNIIGIASYTIEEERKKLLHAGADYCIAKPIYKKSLAEALENLSANGQVLSVA